MRKQYRIADGQDGKRSGTFGIVSKLWVCTL
jgi:hypothetical protein